MKFNLGEVLRDKVTGFKGVVMVRSEYHTGCNHYGLLSQKLKDGKPTEWEYFDESLLVSCKEKKVIEKPEFKTSGPHPNVPQM